MKRFLISFGLMLIFVLPLTAQEGMWLLSQIGQLDLAKKGLQVPVTDIYKPGKPGLYKAVVQLGGGTASFVSSEGLLITNHHVAYTALQRSSSVSSNYLTNGFLAPTRAEEIKAPGYQARLMTEMTDVTDEVLASARDITDPVEKDRKINAHIQEMTDAIEKGKDDVEARISPMFNGRQYILYVSKVFKDIRLVYCPPMAIGNYGGEIDNWMWPRHTGDFSFLRVYVSPEGKGAEYSDKNVPYKPEVWLKVASKPNSDGDFNFIIGYPGFTTRYRSSTSVHWNQEYNYPFAIGNFHEIISICEELTKNDPEGKIKVANLVKGLANVMKNYEGKVEGMKKTHFLQKKRSFEKDFEAWANSKPETKALYGDLLAREAAQYKVLEKTKERDNVMGIFGGLASTQLSVAGLIYGSVRELEKPDGERQPGVTRERLDETRDNLQYTYANYFEPVDKALFVRALKMAGALPKDQRIAPLESIVNNPAVPIQQFADNAFKTSRLNDVEYARSLFGKSSKELEAMDDPFMKMAAALYPLNEEINKINEVFAANVTDLRKEYLDGLYAWKGKGMYPDANGTIRFTWGPVKGYRPADAIWYDPFTSLCGVVEKNTGKEPFNAPSNLVSLYENRDFGSYEDPSLEDVPVAFLNQCDITGGNSGSPVLNAYGEIIGVAFDGNYEAMISDWQYDYNLQRCISVDIRYVMFITEKFSKAGFLLEEMKVAR